nr:hypothetical protein CFP56_09349 [Quercus suber]
MSRNPSQAIQESTAALSSGAQGPAATPHAGAGEQEHDDLPPASPDEPSQSEPNSNSSEHESSQTDVSSTDENEVRPRRQHGVVSRPGLSQINQLWAENQVRLSQGQWVISFADAAKHEYPRDEPLPGPSRAPDTAASPSLEDLERGTGGWATHRYSLRDDPGSSGTDSSSTAQAVHRRRNNIAEGRSDAVASSRALPMGHGRGGMIAGSNTNAPTSGAAPLLRRGLPTSSRMLPVGHGRGYTITEPDVGTRTLGEHGTSFPGSSGMPSPQALRERDAAQSEATTIRLDREGFIAAGAASDVPTPAQTRGRSATPEAGDGSSRPDTAQSLEDQTTPRRTRPEVVHVHSDDGGETDEDR